MIRERVSIKEKKTGLTITGGKISAVLKSNIQETGLRLYDQGVLGIAGAIGSYDEEKLYQKAKHMLNFKLPYEAAPAADICRSEDLSNTCDLTETQFVEKARELLYMLSQKYPAFTFSNKINLRESESSLVNDVGANLIARDRHVSLELVIKYRESNSVLDGFGIMLTRDFNFEQVLKTVAWSCEHYCNKVDFSETEEEIPVLLLESPEIFLAKFFTDLRGDVYGSGASLFSGKMGEKLFDERFSLIVNRDPEKTYLDFFDGEGTSLLGDRFSLIENGVLKAPYTSKRMAKQYNLPVTGSASLQYDAVPDATPGALAVAESGKTRKELLGGRKVIYAMMASGGDFTPQGEYASPIQVAYLFQGETCLGRLPQLSMRSHVYDMFGKDFIGLSSDGNYPDSPFHYLAVDMKVKKIDNWL